MTTWILSDPHGGQNEAKDRGLLALLERARERADLLILGDLFAAWLGPARFHTTFQREVMRQLARLRASGRRVGFVVGNRDYLVDDASNPDAFDRVHQGESLLDLEDVPTLVCHGDGIDPSDWSYRIWRRLTRGRTATRGLKRLPASVARTALGRAERMLAPVNRSFKNGGLPRRAREALGRRAFERGATRVLVGHFHHPRVVPVPGGVPVQVAPSWHDHGEVLVCRGPELSTASLATL